MIFFFVGFLVQELLSVLHSITKHPMFPHDVNFRGYIWYRNINKNADPDNGVTEAEAKQNSDY